MTNSITADMHTHSKYSHDSVCAIEDMCASQKEKGTKIFAVTDHFDTASFCDYDVFSPIESAFNAVKEMNKKSDVKILAGVEISEGFWHPDVYEKIINLVDYDVVIGSVHLVKYKNLTNAYSQIDFSKLSEDVVLEYLDAYFDDMLEMIEKTDFDILAHLTCPLRYIKGKYGLNVDISRYYPKIDNILNRIIIENIALEINTSSYDVLNDFMPSEKIIRKYYDLGGRMITLGSDAHISENASINFDKAIELIKNIGFENIYYFKKRKPYKLSL